MTYEYPMASTLPIHLSERRRDHDGSNDSIIRWRHSDMRWYSIPQIRGEGTESRSSTPFQRRVGHRTLEQQTSTGTNLGVGGQGLCPCARSCERVIGRGHRPLSKYSFSPFSVFCGIQNLRQVSVYKVDGAGFRKIADWYHNYLVTSLVARESRLFVGDAICSVSIIDLVEAEGGDLRLESVAKDFRPLWPVAIESLDKDTIIGANVSWLLFDQLKKKKTGFFC